MAVKTWTIEAPDGIHTVELQHGYFSGKRVIKIDGNLVKQSAEFGHMVFDIGSGHYIEIGGQTYIITIRPNILTLGLSFLYDLEPAPEATQKPPIPPIPEP